MIKVYVVGGSDYYASPIKGAVLTDNIKKAQIVLFTGGEDVTPSIYNEKDCGVSFTNFNRDVQEKTIFSHIEQNQLVLGICRGAQFLCAMNGGKLVQDVTNHSLYQTHLITLDNDSTMEVTSTHHQMMYPYNLSSTDYTLVGKCNPGRSSYYIGSGIDSNIIVEKGEPEIVLFHKKNNPICLAIQGHPEMLSKKSEFVKWFNIMIKNLLNK